MGMLSVCMIVKDEEQHLDTCLQSVKGIADEIIIVDTGSTDKTCEIAKQYTYGLFHFDWCDDFSKARNFALEKASKDWILVVDADEVIAQDDHAKIRALIAANDNDVVAYFLRQLEYTNDVSLTGFHPITKKSAYTKNFLGFVVVEHTVRLFKRLDWLRFHWKIHESVLQSLHDKGIVPLETGVSIHHYKQEKSTVFQREKMELYMKLGEAQILDSPHEAKPHYELGLIYYALGRWNDAARMFEKVIAYAPAEYRAYHKLARAYTKLAQFNRAIALYKHYLNIHGPDSDVLAELGLLYCNKQEFQVALEYFQKALAVNPGNVLCRHNLSILYLQLERKEDAVLLLHESEKRFPNPFTFNMLGVCSAQDGKNDEARQYFEKGIACAPESTQQIIVDLKNNLRILENSNNSNNK